MQHEIVCTCGACGHANIGECRKDAVRDVAPDARRAGGAHRPGQDRTTRSSSGSSRSYGSEEMLGAPIDKGFNRLAWLFPYLVGATGAVAVGFAAIQWTRRHRRRRPTRPRRPIPALEERLDDELRNLD